MNAAQPGKNSEPRRRWRRWGGLAVMVGGILWGSAVLMAVDTLTSRSRRPYPELVPDVSGAKIEEVRIKTSDGIELGAWFVRGDDDRPAVLLMHGNGGDRSGRLAELRFLIDARCSVLTLTMRAHGDSTGDQNDFGYSARHDVIAAVGELKSRCPEQPLYVWGGSLSAAAAIFAASSLNDDVDQWLLECPYRDLETAVRRRLKLYLPSMLAEVAHWNLLRGADVCLPHWRDVSPLEAVCECPRGKPVTFIVGERDSRAPPSDAQEMAALIGPLARVIVVPDADHMLTFATDSSPYTEWLHAKLSGPE